MFDNLLTLASQLPTGLTDPRALEKLWREREEMLECERKRDVLGAILEAADILYYAVKAHHNQLIDSAALWTWHTYAASAANMTREEIVRVAEIKYSLRSRPGNPKDDDAERTAVKAYLYGKS